MAKHDKLKLDVAKDVRNYDYQILKYGSTERGKVVDVEVKDIDGVPYNLSGLSLWFVEELYNGSVVVDDGKQEKSGRFVTNVEDLKNGKFSYQFQEGIYQYDGWAHFKFMQNDTVIDTTAGFAIKIIDDIDSDLDEKTYVAYFESIKKEHEQFVKQAQDLLKSAQSLNDGNHSEIQVLNRSLADLTNSHNVLQKAVTDLTAKHNSDNDAVTQRLNDLNSDKDALTQRLNNLNSEKDSLIVQVNSLKKKSDELTSKLSELDVDLNSQKNKSTELEQEIKASTQIPTFKTYEEYSAWAENNPYRLAIVDDD